ncbi:hypothetical protein S245_003242 [Arachis hypogaea]|nr:uncharacterized protein DS421_1g31500 [Arachis hypogaea]
MEGEGGWDRRCPPWRPVAIPILSMVSSASSPAIFFFAVAVSVAFPCSRAMDNINNQEAHVYSKPSCNNSVDISPDSNIDSQSQASSKLAISFPEYSSLVQRETHTRTKL